VLTAATSTRTAFMTVGLGAMAMTVTFVRLAAASSLGQPRDPFDVGPREAAEEMRDAVLVEPVSVERADL